MCVYSEPSAPKSGKSGCKYVSDMSFFQIVLKYTISIIYKHWL